MILRSTLLKPLAALTLLLLLPGCVQITLAWAPDRPRGAEATPVLLTEGDNTASWEARREDIRTVLEKEVYGMFPEDHTTEVIEHRLLDDEAYGGLGVYEEFDLRVTPIFSANGPNASGSFTMSVLSPANADGPVPVIMMETFCPRAAALPHRLAKGASENSGEMPGMVSYVFGRYICTPPLEMILNDGFAVAMVSSTDVVPDSKDAGLAALDRLAAGHDDDETRWGAIGAWAWVFSRMVDVLAAEERFDGERLISYGHSRYGKAALVAAAFDDRIAGAIGHQSGTGGASLNRRKVGESVKAITKSYPHWFAPRYAEFGGDEASMTVDQHHLLALIAPRPVLLGNARRDVWSDPNGAFKAAVGAAPVYELYGVGPITLERLDRYDPEQALSFWMRPGTHGVVEEDWPAFLAFLTAHFGD